MLFVRMVMMIVMRRVVGLINQLRVFVVICPLTIKVLLLVPLAMSAVFVVVLVLVRALVPILGLLKYAATFGLLLVHHFVVDRVRGPADASARSSRIFGQPQTNAAACNRRRCRRRRCACRRLFVNDLGVSGAAAVAVEQRARCSYV